MSGDGGSLSEYDACVRVAGEEFGNGPCGEIATILCFHPNCVQLSSNRFILIHCSVTIGPQCNPEVCNAPTPTPSSSEVLS